MCCAVPLTRRRVGPGRRRRGWLLLVPLLLLPACGRRTHAPSPVSVNRGSHEEGIASWYGPGFHGRTTANGETYDMYGMTAAHKTLPFDTWVQVVNLDNRQSTVVRINDRGPFIPGRIIDLSRTAAESIQMVGPGTARVKLLIVDDPAPPRREDTVERKEAASSHPARGGSGSGERPFQVQVGAFSRQANALGLRARLAKLFPDVTVSETARPQGRVFRVRVGRFGSRESALRFRELLLQEALVEEAVVMRAQP